MGCNGIKYSSSMQPKTRGAPLQLARFDRSGAAHKSAEKQSRCWKAFQLQVERLDLYLCPQRFKKKKERKEKAHPCYFGKEDGGEV